MRLSTFFVHDVEDHLEREGSALGPIVQRTILRRSENGDLTNTLTVISVQHFSDTRVENYSDETEDFILVQESLTQDVFRERLKSLSSGLLKASKFQAQIATSSFESDFHGGHNTYSQWSGRLFQVRAPRTPLTSGPLLGGREFYIDLYGARFFQHRVCSCSEPCDTH